MASDFEIFVDAALPVKVGFPTIPAGGNATAGKFPRFTGVGLLIEEADAAGGYPVFITDINPISTGTVANKVYTDTVVLVSCESDTTAVTVSVLAFTGKSHLKPVVTVNGATVTNLALDSQMRWAGTVAITAASTDITIVHEDGGSYTATMTPAVGPAFTNLHLTGGYPGSQTELAAGNTFSITFSTNMTANQVEVADFEAATVASQALTPGTGPFSMSVTIASRGAGPQANQRVKIRCRATNGIWGAYTLTDVFGSGDGSAYVRLNNDVPYITPITQTNVTYPATQQALKGSEQATVNHTITCNSGSFTAAYTSNGELTIVNASTYESAKTVTRAGGTYNISTVNFTVTATKVTNARTASRTVVVYIANTVHTTAISVPAARLRSSPGGSSYVVTITANQQLLSAPVLSDLVAGQGTWQGTGFAGSGTTWTRSMTVADTDSKGTFNFTGLTSINLAGQTSHAILSGAAYVLGGFILRIITFAAWPNRESAIGTTVSNTSKLKCTNLSKGSSGSLNDTFQATIADAVDKYTITNPSGVYNATGNLAYNCDLPNSVSNTSGNLQWEISEDI